MANCWPDAARPPRRGDHPQGRHPHQLVFRRRPRVRAVDAGIRRPVGRRGGTGRRRDAARQPGLPADRHPAAAARGLPGHTGRRPRTVSLLRQAAVQPHTHRPCHHRRTGAAQPAATAAAPAGRPDGRAAPATTNAASPWRRPRTPWPPCWACRAMRSTANSGNWRTRAWSDWVTGKSGCGTWNASNGSGTNAAPNPEPGRRRAAVDDACTQVHTCTFSRLFSTKANPTWHRRPSRTTARRQTIIALNSPISKYY